MISKSNKQTKNLIRVAILLLLLIALILVGISYFAKKAEEKERTKEVEKILVGIDKDFEESTTITKDEIVKDRYGTTIISIHTKEAYEIARIISKKLLLSDEENEEKPVDDGYHEIYFGNYRIDYQYYYGSLYRIDLDKGETLIKDSFDVHDLIYDDVQSLIKLIEEKNKNN